MRSRIFKFVFAFGILAGIVSGSYRVIQNNKKMSSASSLVWNSKVLETKVFLVERDDPLRKVEICPTPITSISPTGEELGIIYSLGGNQSTKQKGQKSFFLRIYSRKYISKKDFSIPLSTSTIVNFNPPVWSQKSSKVLLYGKGWKQKDFLWAVDIEKGEFIFLGETVSDKLVRIFQPWNMEGDKVLVAHQLGRKGKIGIYIREIGSGKEKCIWTSEVFPGEYHPWLPVKGKTFALWEPDSNIIYIWQNETGVFAKNPQDLAPKKIYGPLPSIDNWVWLDSLYYPRANWWFADAVTKQDIEKKTLLPERRKFFVYEPKSLQTIYTSIFTIGSSIPCPSIYTGTIRLSPDGKVVLIHPFDGSVFAPNYIWVLDLREKARVVKLKLSLSNSEQILDIRWGGNIHTIFVATSNKRWVEEEPLKFFKLYKILIAY